MITYKSSDIVLIQTSQIITVVRSALSKIDPRLVSHGERVGYLASKICQESEDRDTIDLTRLLILSALHDIGAYKTEEIDDLVQFETESVFDHSLYGYLFLRSTTHLAEYAEAVLFHHTDYAAPVMRTCRYAKYAQLIHLADRTDILMTGKDVNLALLRNLAGTKFNPRYVEALLQAEEKYGLSRQLSSGAYHQETEAMYQSLDIPSSEIMDYLRLLVYAIDFRSPFNVTHTADTTIIGQEVGKLLGLDERDLQALYLGAFLHDIGKIAIPHDILEKPGRLTREEYDIIKTHIPEGERILRGVVSDEICNIALRHHEKLDGSGYSQGLSAESLTLPQRIVAVADVLSALSQQRSYKEAYPKDRVISILTDMKQTGQLCPLVTDTVCDSYDAILACTEESHNPVKQLYTNMLREYRERSSQLRGG